MLRYLQVYDVTEFAARHPGGRDFLMATVGRDATAMFESLHDPKAIKVLAYVRSNPKMCVTNQQSADAPLRKRQIGTLIESDMPQYPTQTPFQVELRKVREMNFRYYINQLTDFSERCRLLQEGR